MGGSYLRMDLSVLVCVCVWSFSAKLMFGQYVYKQGECTQFIMYVAVIRGRPLVYVYACVCVFVF